MGTIIMAGQLILALAILVSLHEWGHYIAARSFGIRVEKFFIFFDAWGAKLFSKQIGETEWGIGWLPLGGYVKITGMIDESLDKEQLASEPQDYEFRSKPAWQRLIVMIGGVTINFILGVLIFALSMFYYGETWLPNAKVIEKGGVVVTDLGKAAGFETGDKIVSINGQEVEKFRDLINSSAYIVDGLNYGVVRDGATVLVPISDSLRTRVLESKGKLAFFSLRLESIIGGTAPDGNAQKAGLLPNDKIVGIDTINVQFFDQLKDALSLYRDKIANLKVLRNGSLMTVSTNVDSLGMIGIQVSNLAQYSDDLQRTEYGFFESFPAGYNKGVSLLKDNIVAF
jgi:regulator of sigma E protease